MRLLLLIPLLLTVIAAAEPTQHLATNMFSGEALPVRELDDPANPYHGQYTGWDRWLFEHIDRSITPNSPAKDPPGSTWRQWTVRLDADGWLVPMAEQFAGQYLYERINRDYRLADWGLKPWSYVEIRGELTEEKWTDLKLAYLAARRAAFAKTFPPLPGWLRGKPIALLVFLPDGSLITYGNPGSFDPANPYEVGEDYNLYLRIEGPHRYYRFSPTGTLLGELEGQGDLGWLPLTWPEAEHVYTSAEAQGQEAQVVDGYLLVFAETLTEPRTFWPGPSTIQYTKEPRPPLVAAYDWDGTPLDLTKSISRSDGFAVLLQWEDEIAFLAASGE